MLEILEFIFSSFWVWLGTVFLVLLIAGTFGDVLIRLLSFVCRRKAP